MFSTISECTYYSFPPTFSELLFEIEKREGGRNQTYCYSAPVESQQTFNIPVYQKHFICITKQVKFTILSHLKMY